MINDMLGRGWREIAKGCSDTDWLQICRDAAHKYYISKNMPVDPRRKTAEEEDGGGRRG